MPQRPPDPLPEGGPFAALNGWLNRLRAYVLSTTPRTSVNCGVSHTAHGTFMRPKVAETAASESTFPMPVMMAFRDDYSGELDYSIGDVVTVVGGANAGLWICRQPAAAGTAEPGVAAVTVWKKIAEGFRPLVWE